jgi:ubiquinone/menaquinone biosynthesis C-methylase UbiE
MNPANHFDDSAQSWDSDPVKLDRAAAVAKAILNHVSLSPEMRALEYGCGTGLLSFRLRPHLAHITLADSSSGMLAVLDQKIRAINAANMVSTKLDLVTDPLPQDTYDLIYTLMTFHHIADTDSILRMLFSLLAPSGYLCVADLDTEDGSFHGPDFSGHKGFDREELGQKAKQAGFKNVSFSTVFQMPKDNNGTTTDYPVFLMVASK